MIVVYSGLMRSGKTLSAIEDFIIPFLKKGREVYTNIGGLDYMRFGFFLKCTTSEVRRNLHLINPDLDVKQLSDYVASLRVKRNCLIVIDEAHEWLSSENYSKLASFRSFISWSGHYGHDLVLITQSIDDLWSPIRARVGETHLFVRGKLGSNKSYEEFIWAGHNILVAYLKKKTRWDNKEIYSLYKSTELGADDKGVKYISMWQNNKLRFLMFVAFFCIGIAVYRIATHGIPLKNIFFREKEVELKDAKKFNIEDHIIYVRYVSCDLTRCTGILQDNSSVFLPLDYDSGKYPFKVKEGVKNANSGNLLSNDK